MSGLEWLILCACPEGHPESIANEHGDARGARASERASSNRSARRSVSGAGAAAVRPGDPSAHLNPPLVRRRTLLLWTSLAASLVYPHNSTESVRKAVHHVGEQGGGEEETGRHHQPLERQPARPVRDQPAHGGREAPQRSRRGRGRQGLSWANGGPSRCCGLTLDWKEAAMVGSVVRSLSSPPDFLREKECQTPLNNLVIYNVTIHHTASPAT